MHPLAMLAVSRTPLVRNVDAIPLKCTNMFFCRLRNGELYALASYIVVVYILIYTKGGEFEFDFKVNESASWLNRLLNSFSQQH